MSTFNLESDFTSKLGVQAWCLRDALAKDVAGSYALFRDWGFKNLEIYTIHDLSPEAMRAMLDGFGLKATAYHVSLDRWENDLEAVLAECRILGTDHVGLAWIKDQDDEVVTIEHIKRASKALKAAEAPVLAAGMTPYYHIHGYEFAPYGEGTLMDVLLAELAGSKIELELDVFWAKHAGQDPVEIIHALGPQLTMLHLKDMRQGTESNFSGGTDYNNFVPLGEGILDLPAILAAAEAIGVAKYWIEDESPQPTESIPTSLTYLGILQQSMP